MQLIPLLLALAALFVAPAACALGTGVRATLQLEARELAFQGDSLVKGPLGAFKLQSTDMNWRPAPSDAFELRADRLTVETHWWKADYGLVLTTTPGRTGTESNEYRQAAVNGEAPRADFEFVVAPAPGAPAPRLDLNAAGGSLVSPSVREVTSRDAANDPNSDGLRVPTAGATELATGVGLERARIRGTFVVHLWSWNVTVVDPDHADPDAYWSGRREQSVVKDPFTPGVRSDLEKQQLLLNVVNGTLDLGVLPAARAVLLWRALEVWTEILEAHDAGAILSDRGVSRPIQAEAVRLEGRLHAETRQEPPGRIAADVDGTITRSLSDGQPLAVAVPAGARGAGWWFTWIGLGLALPAGAWTARTAGRQLEARRMDRLEKAAVLGDDAGVLAVAGRLERSRAFGRDAAVLKVESLLRLGQVAAARAYVESLRGWDGPAAPVHDYLQALVQALSGQAAPARALIIRVLGAAPELHGEITRHPALAPLLRHPDVRAALPARVRPRDLGEGYQ